MNEEPTSLNFPARLSAAECLAELLQLVIKPEALAQARAMPFQWQAKQILCALSAARIDREFAEKRAQIAEAEKLRLLGQIATMHDERDEQGKVERTLVNVTKSGLAWAALAQRRADVLRQVRAAIDDGDYQKAHAFIRDSLADQPIFLAEKPEVPWEGASNKEGA